MPFVTIATNSWEDEMTAIKAAMEKLTKENKENEVRIKLQEEQIARLTR